MPAKPQLDQNVLRAALEGLEAQRQRIESQIAEVRRMLRTRSATNPTASAEPTPGQRRTLSTAARKRIAEAQRKRWQEFHKKSGQPAMAQKSAAPTRKRKLSAAGRRAISEATKKRWAAARAAKKAQAKVEKG